MAGKKYGSKQDMPMKGKAMGKHLMPDGHMMSDKEMKAMMGKGKGGPMKGKRGK